MWRANPALNHGIATGRASRLIVIDLDNKNGKDGVTAFAGLCAELGVDLPETYTVETPTGGRHLYFIVPAGFAGRIGNRVDAGGLPGVDVRGEGGFVVGPGSVRADGTYRVLDPDAPVAELSGPLLEWLTADRRPAAAPARSVASAADDTPAGLILAHDPFTRHCRDDAATITYQEWFALGSNLALADGGAELFHELSALDPTRYDPAATDRLIRDAKQADKPCTVDHIEAELGFRGYECWSLRGTVRAPVDLKNADAALLDIQARYVLVTDVNRYHDLADGSDHSPDTINSRHAHRLAKGRPHDALIRSRFTAKVDRADYRPDLPELVFREGGSLVLNRHAPGGVEPAEGDCGVLLDHLAYLIPGEVEREHVLDVLAFMLQRPAEKVRHAVLLTGPQGTGKSFLRGLAAAMVGAGNVGTVENDALHSKWRRGWGNRRVLVLEEPMAPGRLELGNSLKPLITEESFTVEDKNVPLHEVRTPRVVLGFTNHPDAICIEAGDRRWFVAETTREVRDRGYFDRLWTDGLGQAAALKEWLLRRDLSRFSPDAPPPETAAKAALRGLSRTPLAQEIRAAIEDGEAGPAVVAAGALRDILVDRGVFVQGGVSPVRVAKALGELGFRQYPGNVRLPGLPHPTKPWIAPEAADVLLRATGAEVARAYGAGSRPLLAAVP